MGQYVWLCTAVKTGSRAGQAAAAARTTKKPAHSAEYVHEYVCYQRVMHIDNVCNLLLTYVFAHFPVLWGRLMGRIGGSCRLQ